MSGHRPIAPSTGRSELYSSSSGRVSESTEPRSFSQTTSNTSPDSAGLTGAAGFIEGRSQRRRRAPGNVTAMACTECRQARQKCDGERPDPCSRCMKRKLSCIYQPHVKAHKDDLIREIEDLHKDKSKLEDENKDISEAHAGLQSQNRDLQESSEWSNIILETITKNGHDREIIARLRAGQSHQEIADWLNQDVQIRSMIDVEPQTNRLLEVVNRYENEYQDEDGLRRRGRSQGDELQIPWTTVSSSRSLIGHLFDLYFTWVHPVHMLFSELDFKYSFRTSSGHNCSTALVNAICAMACHLLEKEGAGKSKGTAQEAHDQMFGDAQEAVTLREGFMDEARRVLTKENHKEMTSVQAFAVMYLVELGSCKARKALGYLRASVENLGAAVRNQSDEARQITTWGIHSLNTACVGVTYQKFYTPDLPRIASFSEVQMDRDDDIWRFYRSVGDEREMPHRPSHAILSACYQAKLFRIIRNSLNLYCGYSGKVTAHKVVACYKEYTDWRAELPDVLHNVDVNAQPLPNILYLHIVYHTALLQHLVPLLQCNYFRPPDQDEMRRMMVYHARCGLDIVEHSSRLYTSRYQTPLLSFCVLHLGDALIRHSPHSPPASEVVVFCLEILAKTSLGFAVCGPLSSLFRATATECGIPLPDDLDDKVGESIDYTIDDILDACTRLTYTQPTEQIFRHLDKAIGIDWASEWQKQVVEGHRPPASAHYMAIGSVLNE